MSNQELTYFQKLKDEVSGTFIQANHVDQADYRKWKGQDIVNFQEDLMAKVGGRISEKWFYTHVKADNQKLPRIDMLNMLSEYAGYKDRADFKGKHGSLPIESKLKQGKKKFPVLILFLLIPVLGGSAFAYWKANQTEKYSYQFCFVDTYGNTPITGLPIFVHLLRENQSPLFFVADSSGCVHLESEQSTIQFVVECPYHRKDTITRILHDNSSGEFVRLKSDDYAQMIHYFSASKIMNWKKRRTQLEEMFAANAKIYQVFSEEGRGVELYNKKEFINKLTMPVKSLKNIEVIETIYTGDEISVMRFRQTIMKEVSNE